MKTLTLLFTLIFSITCLQAEGDIVSSARDGSLDSVKTILSAGANINTVDQYKNTALHFAVFHEDYKMTALLLEHGADINLQNDNGDTPLHIACGMGSLELVELLISKGGNPQIKNKLNWLPADVATDQGYPDIVTTIAKTV